MNQTLVIVLPVFGMIGVGFLISAVGVLSEETGEALADFVFVIAIPVLIFRTIAVADFGGADPWRLWAAFFVPFAVIWAAGDAVVRWVFGRDRRAALVAGVSAAYGNTVLVGVPLAMAAYGELGAVAVTLIIAVHLPVAMTASAILIGRAERLDNVPEADSEAAAGVLRNLATSPIIIGIVLGALWRLIGIPLTGVPATMVGQVADVASTLALLALGMTLHKYGVGRNVVAGLALAALKLLAMPALVLILARYVVAMPPVWVKVAVVAAACPTGVNAYLVASRFRTGEALASNAIAISTALAVFTTAFWLHVVEWL